jgi:3-hydroxyacyl-CoA dehydrogenase
LEQFRFCNQDLGDGIINFEIRSKMNSLGGEVLDGLNRAIDLAEKEYDGLVIKVLISL